MLTYRQTSFVGGINMLAVDASIEPAQYVVGFNIRTRNADAKPIKSPVEISTPAGKIQGGIVAGNIQVLFIQGRAFYRIMGSETWTMISDFKLDSDVDRIYCLAVPYTAGSGLRKLVVTNDSASGITIDTTIGTGSPACLICQDGINQPWIIFSDGTARVAKNYSQWSLTNREYIPIGKQMMLFQNTVYIVSPNGNLIYRSVSGRYLDFVVNIDTTGNKGGDAITTSFAVDYNTITCIQPLNADAFFVGTPYRCYSVVPDYTNKIFGEPQFIVNFLYSTGVINQFCFTEALGDFCFIDYDGLRSFNAVKQLLSEGKNSVFSQKIASLFDGVKQNPATACAITFNNYVYFSIETIFGKCILVYDTINNVFSSIDLHSASNVKQFLTSYNETEQKLFAITTNNKFYELECGDTFELPIVQTKAFIANDSLEEPRTIEQRSRLIKCVLHHGETAGILYITELADGQKSFTKQMAMSSGIAGIAFPVEFPIMVDSSNDLNSITIKPTNNESLVGYKISYILSWDTSASLSSIAIEADEQDRMATRREVSKTFNN